MLEFGPNKVSDLSSPRIKLRTLLRLLLIFVVYLLAFAILDLSSRALEVYPGIVAWYPPDGLSFALLLTLGAGFLPAVAIATLVSSLFIFQFHLPFSTLLEWSILLPLTYGLAVWFLRKRIRIDTQLRGIRDLIWLIASSNVVATILAWVSVYSSTTNGVVPQAELFWATFQRWVGEIIGILVLTPFLLIHVMPSVKRFVQGEGFPRISLRRPPLAIILQAFSIIVAIYLAVEVNWPNDFHPFFLIGIPLVWIAIQYGLAGVTLGNVLANFGVTWAVQGHQHFELTELGQLQSMMLIITMASLVIGIIITEYKRSTPLLITEIEQRRKKIAYETIIVCIVGLSAWVLEYTFNFYEAVIELQARHQIGIDETLVTILVLGIASGVFSLRRWREYQVELRTREKAQDELNTLYNELETRVQERTTDLSTANASLQLEIIEREQVETALENIEAKYRILVEQLPAITYIVEFGETTNANYISPQIESILGFSAEEWLADPNLWGNQLHPDDHDKVLAEFDLRDKLSQPIDLDYRILTRDGRVRWIHDQSVLILDDNGHPHYAHGLLFDITARKQAEEALEQRERRFRALIENSADAITLLDSNGAVIYDSPAASGMLGYRPDEWIGQNIFKLIHADDLASIQPLFQRLSETLGARSENIFRVRHQNGSWRWIESVTTNLLADPSVQAIVANYRDITERKQAEEQIQIRAAELSTLYEFSRALSDANDLDEVLDLVNRRAVESMHVTFVRIALLEGDEFIIRSAHPIRPLNHDLLVGSRISIAAMPYCQHVLEQNEPIIVQANTPEISGEERAALLLLDFVQTLCLIPLRVHDFASHSSQFLGLLMVGETRQEEREPFTAEKMRLARSIGDQAAIAIDKARLFKDLQRSNNDLNLAYDATIAGWSAALDLRDKETEGHTQRVTEITLKLAKQMGLSEQELVHVRRGALLHDIGKMGVPDNILLKPDKLTDEEWKIMRMHPTYAYQMLEPITYVGPALNIPYCHHEKWDGRGYPRGLKGEEIPLAARIFAIVDVYDALTSDRPYRKGWPIEKTLEHIREQSGTHFDPQVVEVFLKMIATPSAVSL